MITLYVHIEGLETTLMEVDELPNVTDTLLVGRNPRRRDGKDVSFIMQEVNTLILPINRVVFIEVMTDEQEEEIETFIRE
ncbi:MAG TPA: hypothetical protein VJZ27_15340 [Aggregatilineales bacterium]|nr:hypothetical protein [Aggregatilineales bacterium]